MCKKLAVSIITLVSVFMIGCNNPPPEDDASASNDGNDADSDSDLRNPDSVGDTVAPTDSTAATDTPTDAADASTDTTSADTSTSTSTSTSRDSASNTAVVESDSFTDTATIVLDSETETVTDARQSSDNADSADSDDMNTDAADTHSPDSDSGTLSVDTTSAGEDSAADNNTGTDTGTDTDTNTATDVTDTTTQTNGDSDPPPQSWCVADGMTPYTSADILLVVDNSGSMVQEQEILATALFTLINSLSNSGDDRPPIDDVRIAVTTTDMGVSYAGVPYDDVDSIFANGQVKCYGIGDNGAFVTEYTDNTVNIMDGAIACETDADNCPPGWICDTPDTDTNRFCMVPSGVTEEVLCPASPADAGTHFIPNDRNDKALAVACLAGNIGSDGCNYEQQLKSGSAALTNNGADFIRANSLTAIVVVSDEDDCSIASDEWHELDELQKVTANLACGRHHDLLDNISDLKSSYEAAKIAAGGSAEDLVFAAIGGVPIVPECQGTGDTLGDCLDVHPAVNGAGTMGAPEEVARETSSGVEQYYFEYACQRYADGADTDNPDVRPITAAYPGIRYIQMAQAFGDRGYMFSICNRDWSQAMENIAEVVQDNVQIICLE